MYKKLPNKNQAANWEYLPNINTIVKYLYRGDLMELSLCCKRYRNQLEHRVLEKLDLNVWKYNNWNTYNKLKETGKVARVLKFLKSDLDNKHKFIKKVTLESDIQVPFAKELNILLPNIKTLILHGDYFDNSVGLGLITILKGLKNLEIVKLNRVWGPIIDFNTKRKTFPISIKSLVICDFPEYKFDDGILTIYDSIDHYFTNLYSLTIATNRVLQNLSYGMPNLREVELKDVYILKGSNIVAFLKANPQLEKLTTNFMNYNEEILKTILSIKNLKYWNICYGSWEEIKAYSLPSNYSINYLKLHDSIPAALTYKFTNACKTLETLDLGHYKLHEFNWSTFDRRIPILKISYNIFKRKNINRKAIKSIDDSRKFNSIHTERESCVIEFIEKYGKNTLNNYKYIPSNTQSYIFKLIN
ncbi:hypothetical protein CONCODRAFT_11342 [Conidiobolus coronatus NRRL 28638]|uniref:F-box domain-containing protein n=1 Tax=Conidiobolus coronatus (strain ATCC 28846 / CBS 209.66 / NRRL 28638) TaxID=796925 RepID=A0A137NV88_CONC2|nr:hypothetical protein CONCODRAFT_11342 [Conidiobolus coronatus NRRL 28638]|eukprot:KXN66733.1 hypothetical protein CONCODRAFT_11342 [Conidiobolus coronatus NRRL 28638]